MSEKLKRFIDLMRNIFELDKSDLDFGIYRIMNIREEEIRNFFETDLVNRVQETLEPFALNTDTIEKRISEIEKTCEDVGIAIESSKMATEYGSLKSQLSAGVDMSAMEADVYSALYSFFNRYYDEGDFISKRRYKEGVYAIPYEGEEVKLHWANQDQYYIKTTENFKDYTFKDGNLNIHFRLVDATVEQNNNIEQKNNKRVFMLYEENDEYPDIKTFEQQDNDLIIRFIFDVPTDKKRKYTEENAAKIVEAITKQHKEFFSVITPRFMDAKTKRQTKSLLDKHLEAYVAKNTFDYFIHKDLHDFLTRELDFYIKNEIVHLDDLDTTNEKRVETYLAKIKAIKRVGKIIIDFLAQIEDFQKKLWLKKKFIVETNWCITLDKIDHVFYEEIIKNKAQVDEWIEMYSIDQIEDDGLEVGYSEPLTIEFLKQNQKLLVDTKLFTIEFKERLIASIDNIDEQTNGLLIHSENFQALNLLQTKYNSAVDCCYIDPPYNAKSSEILYKNTFKHSSWLSLMNNRIELSKPLLNDNPVFICAIDEIEQEKLGSLFDMHFPENYGKTCVSIVHNPSGQQGDNFSYTHEFAYFLYKVPGRHIAEQYREDPKEWDERNFRDVTGEDSKRKAGPNCFYPILIKDGKIIGFGDVCEDKNFHPPVNVLREDGVIEVYPIDPEGVERKWRFARDTVEKIQEQLKVHHLKQRDVYDIKRLKTTFNYKSVWQGSKYSANNYGTQILNQMFKEAPFSYPKSVFTVMDCISAGLNGNKNGLVLDYFAGSGTTAQAIINLNKDGGNRKYILAEMGEYFYSATLPRVKKSIYYPAIKGWKKGQPLKHNAGVSQIVKYISLESYEDALSNIELSDKGEQMYALFGEDYLINYMLDIEAEGSLLKLDYFKTPFEYKLKVTESNESREKVIDVVETFNYLTGLSVMSQTPIGFYDVVPNPEGDYEGSMKLIEDPVGSFAFKQIIGTLPDGRRALVIWRNITDNLIQSNAALDTYFAKYIQSAKDYEFDVVFVNGDNNLESLRANGKNWEVRIIELDFKKNMFEGV